MNVFFRIETLVRDLLRVFHISPLFIAVQVPRRRPSLIETKTNQNVF
jgi:hypothetical protein